MLRRSRISSVWPPALVLLACNRPTGNPPDFFRAPTPAGEANAAASPLDGRMPLTIYSLQLQDLPTVVESGFNMVGPYYDGGNSGGVADAALRAGLRLAYQFELPSVDYVSGRTRVLDSAFVLRQVRSQMATVYADPVLDSAVALWSVVPEELRVHRELERRHLELVVRTVREVERERGRRPRPIWMYNPGNRRVWELALSGKYADLLVMGAYLNASARDRWSIGDKAARTAQASKLLPHRPLPVSVLWMADDPTDPRDRDAATIRRTVRHDAYLALVRGTRGLFVFSGFRRPGFTTYDRYLQAYASVMHDLTGPHGLAGVLMSGEERDDIQLRVHGRGPVAYASIAYRGARYLFVVNSGEDSATVLISGLPATVLWREAVFSGVVDTVTTGAFAARLEPLGVAVWRISPITLQGLGPSAAARPARRPKRAGYRRARRKTCSTPSK